MRHPTLPLAFAALALMLVPAAARAEFGLLPGAQGFDVRVVQADGVSPADLAGSHPYEMTTRIAFEPASPGGQLSDGDVRDISLELPAGLIENPQAVPRCSRVLFNTPRVSPFEASLSGESCPRESQIGVVTLDSSFAGGSARSFGVFNLEPPPGYPSQLGFSPFGTPITFTPEVRETGREYGLTLALRDFPQLVDVRGIELTIWGTPWAEAHDGERGNCLNGADIRFPHAKCQVKELSRRAYLTLPTSCEEPFAFRLAVNSWQHPAFVRAGSEATTLRDCGALGFVPKPLARLNTVRAGSPSGFEFAIRGNGEGLVEPAQRAGAQAKEAVLALPPGATVNPSVGAGLGVCTRDQYAAETAFSAAGEACPNSSQIGELTVTTPLLEGPMTGALYLAQPDDPATAEPGAENPFDALIALYVIAKSPQRGVMVRLAGKVDADPASGRLTATFDDLPQLPYSEFNLRFRDTQRSALASPDACGTHVTRVHLAPWTGPDSFRGFESSSDLSAGIDGGPCPSGTRPFRPGATAGTYNRNAGSYTPYYLHLTRADPDQEVTSYSALLPPGLTGKLKGIPYCPEAAIAEAARKSGFEEQRDPSCPEASRIGRTTSGFGLGSVLAYAPGGLYLAGPYRGSSFSIVAIDSATVGPFDLGVIIVRSAIKVDPRTAQVSVDSTGSDPIPHIIRGIPIHLRDIRVYIDRPGFTLNPTSCLPFTASSSLSGSGPDFASAADDTSAGVSSPFQVSNCSGLGFEPSMSFRLRGGSKRGDYPAFRATVRPRMGDANLGQVQVTLPPSLFLAQEHIRTICTRVQFAAKRCPPASVYGRAKAVTPLLGRPLEGPVYLRSSGNPLPDLVADLSGNGIEIEIAGRIDSVRGGLRGTFDVIPDAPVSRFTMDLFGGKRAPLVVSDDLCASPARVKARVIAQNNRGTILRPRLAVRCRGARGGRGR